MVLRQSSRCIPLGAHSILVLGNTWAGAREGTDEGARDRGG